MIVRRSFKSSVACTEVSFFASFLKNFCLIDAVCECLHFENHISFVLLKEIRGQKNVFGLLLLNQAQRHLHIFSFAFFSSTQFFPLKLFKKRAK